jgi:hypothetical protein
LNVVVVVELEFSIVSGAVAEFLREPIEFG